MRISKIRKKGIAWVLGRLKYEFRRPTNSIISFLVDSILIVRKKIFGFHSKKISDDFLYAIFDLEIAPITFNITEFVIDAEYEANRLGKKGFIVVFVPKKGESSYVWEEYDSVVDEDSKSWRFENIVLPVTRMSQKCKGVYMLPNRSEVLKFVQEHEIYPELYDGINLRYIDIVNFYKKMNRPNMVEGLSASKQGLQYINQWIVEEKITNPVVTITIRQYGFDQARNSNLPEWINFANYLKKSGYYPVIIPDTDKSFGTEKVFSDLFVFKECAWNVGLRMALYELSFLNFFVPHGPTDLAQWNKKCSYIAMNCLPENSLLTTKEAYKKIGYKIGEDHKFALPNQRLVYVPDTYENILDAFNDFVKDNN